MGVFLSNFRALPGSSVLVNVVATSAAAALPGPNPGDVEMDYRLSNAGPGDVFFIFGVITDTVLANGTAVHLPAGTVELFLAPRGATHIVTIGDSGATARLFVTRGEGA